MNIAGKLENLLASQLGDLRFAAGIRYRDIVDDSFIDQLSELVAETTVGSEAMVEVEAKCLLAELRQEFANASRFAKTYLGLIQRLRDDIAINGCPEDIKTLLMRKADDAHMARWQIRLNRLVHCADIT